MSALMSWTREFATWNRNKAGSRTNDHQKLKGFFLLLLSLLLLRKVTGQRVLSFLDPD
eukprot:m.102956 g.102956  ORF g.102956 m.102956 type:complete len:58 (+) comp9087_c1_seq1:2368-2541(+)